MALVKAKIEILDSQGSVTGSIDCLFNPTTVKFSRSAEYQTTPIPQKTSKKEKYTGGGRATLSVTLLFDTTSSGESVRTKYIDKLFDLLKVETAQDGTVKPPYCRFVWKDNYFDKGYLKNVDVTYMLFKEDGTPIRAEVGIGMEEAFKEVAGTNPTSRSEARKTWLVREGDRLDWIAYKEYGQAAHWRHIAEANDIDDPFHLQPGQILKLTPLK